MSDVSGAEDPDVLSLVRMYMETLELRMSPEEFRAVADAVDAYWRALEEAEEGAFKTDEERLTTEAHREYLMVMAIASTGRLDLEVVEMPAPDGTVGWAVVDTEIAEDPARLAELRRQLSRSADDHEPPH